MKTLKTILTAVVVTAIFYFLIAYLVRNWQKIPFDSLHFNTANLIISFGFLLVNFLLFINGWKLIMRRLGSALNFATAFWIISLSQVAKYVPGGIWFALGRVYLGRAKDLKADAIAISVVIETALTFLACILLLFLSLIFAGKLSAQRTWLVIPAFLVFLVLMQPSVLNWFLGIALKIFRRPAVTLDMSYRQLLELSIYFIGFLVAQLLGFYFLINSIYAVNISKIFELSAAYLISWMSGFVVVFAPGGLGVREGMMTLLLSPILPVPLAIAISFLSRVWLTIFEIVIFITGLIVRKATHRDAANNT